MSIANKDKLAYIGSKPGTDSRDADSWYTPAKYLGPVRSVLGGKIDFDPFSSAHANKSVQATTYYTEADDAFIKEWPEVDSVFMNPPYSRGLAGKAVDTFLANLDAGYFARGIVLVNNATDTQWFRRLATHKHCVAICTTFGRIAFENIDGKRVSGNTRGQIFLLFSSEKGNRAVLKKNFKWAFNIPAIGRVWS